MNRPMRTLALTLLALAGLVAGSASAQRRPPVWRTQRAVWPRAYARPQLRVAPALPPCGPVWIAGRYEYVEQRVWIPARERRVWVEPVFETRCDLWGRPRQVLIAPGHWQVVHEPGRYETRRKRVWRPGRYAPRY